MNWKAKWHFHMSGLLHTLIAAAAAGISLWLLYRYAQFGEAPVQEAGSGAADTYTEETASEISAGIPPKEDPHSGTIRVRILGDGYAEEYHEQIEVTCENPLTILPTHTETLPDRPGGILEKCRTAAGESWQISSDELEMGQALCICQDGDALLTVTSLTRADGHPQYAGALLLYREESGIVLVNELPLEEYLCGVVSSEMPSDYPLEAQKAQAVCARTYARNCVRNAEGSGARADLDDSVNDQVYNNYQATASSRKAVRETAGETLPLAEIQYYSTSCQSEWRDDLDNEDAFRDFLSQEADPGAEYGSAWLRWETELPACQILDALAAQSGWHADALDEISVADRSGNGQVRELAVYAQGARRVIRGEYGIRQILSPGQQTIRLMNGSTAAEMPLLPSAFFWLEPVRAQDGGVCSGGKETEAAGTDAREGTVGETKEADLTSDRPVVSVKIHGGGYGHGAGMSQCGAAGLAEEGWNYREILKYYYACEPA